jgi:hypothetical protein
MFNKTLEELCIVCSAIDQDTLVQLIESLKSNSLLSLDLSYCKIADNGLRLLRKVLASNPALTHLDVSWCSDCDVLDIFAESIKVNTTLRSLYIGMEVAPRDDSIKHFKACLEVNSTLVS